MAINDTRGGIKITHNGPYLVYGNISLSEKIITPKGKHYVLKEGRSLQQKAKYALCRCGKSEGAPFCDGSHGKFKFEGAEVASRENYAERAMVCNGPDLDLMDDHRCARARFCHREEGDAWELTAGSDNPEFREEAIIAAKECPSGRLLAKDKSGEEFELEYGPSIDILQDPEKKVSGPISVKGNILIESSDGYNYETRNRVTLCRCGHSCNKPFCDSSHIDFNYRESNL